MFGLTFEKMLLIGALIVFLIGPDRLPQAAATLARLVKQLKGFADGAKTRVRDEMGPEFDEVDWKKLDPRQYDPRRIIREALTDDTPTPAGARPAPRVKPTSIPVADIASAGVAATVAASATETSADAGTRAMPASDISLVAFDDEAT